MPDQPSRSTERETSVLRALSSPVRQEILDRLGRGPATSAMLARELGSNTGVMSYQLRELAKAGLIEADHEEGRNRYWRLPGTDTRFSDPQLSPRPELAQAAIDLRLARFADSVRAYVRSAELDEPWRSASLFSESALTLTAAELATFAGEYLALLGRWRERAPAAAETRPVRVALFAYPDAGAPPNRKGDPS